MDEDYLDEVARHWKSLSTLKRVKVFLYLSEGVPPSQFLEEDEDLDVTRPTIQDYINDFKELDMIEKQGRNYVVTEKGEEFEDLLEDTERVLKDRDRQELEEFEERAEQLRERLDQDEHKE
ncbi:hypothetical protein OB919_15980 [Halobacteria archaeon AArc-curdl1]|uniref:ArnR1-like winged helix-turn-helix domain-containing protein n=1 Tax=Natronosalvus hydrolyticus TaxID=2979988 RepID=A0AAP2ZA16_9EURY|nr:hypothetical protein [Halobacteria archaeon AArc-curdl1]